MKIIKPYIALCSVVLIASSSAVFANEAMLSTIKNLPDEGRGKVSGTVASVEGGNEFMLEDTTGKIHIKTKDVLKTKEGDLVTVEGKIEKNLFSGKKLEDAEVISVSSSLTADPTADSQEKSPSSQPGSIYRDNSTGTDSGTAHPDTSPQLD